MLWTKRDSIKLLYDGYKSSKIALILIYDGHKPSE